MDKESRKNVEDGRQEARQFGSKNGEVGRRHECVCAFVTLRRCLNKTLAMQSPAPATLCRALRLLLRIFASNEEIQCRIKG